MASVLHFVGGILIVGFYYRAQFIKSIETRQSGSQQDVSIFHVALFVLLLVLVTQHYAEVNFERIPIDYRLADMLPVLDVMSERFLQGSYVYPDIPEIWDGMTPVYLPGFWMPFIFHHLFDFDMRWICVICMLAGLILTLNIFIRDRRSIVHILLWSIAVLILLIPILWLPSFVLTHAQEGIAIGYYLLLGYALLTKKWRLSGIAAGLCLMSRYALAPWFLAFSIFLFWMKERKAGVHFFGLATVLAVSLIMIGGGYQHLDVFLGLPDQYLESVMNDPSKYVPTIRESLGLAKFISFEQLPRMHSIFKWSQVLIPIIGFAMYPLIKNWISLEKHAVVILKICLIFFYNLLILPYPYLFFVSTAFSMVLLSSLLADAKSEIA